MDRRSWLWRRKSSEKSPRGETESSGSLSSHSERFSDDQTLSNLNTQSPEVTCKASPSDEQILNESLKTLSEKLSQALLNIRAKEELVNQHAKVAEEAVSGWEKAENEVLGLKKQNDALNQKTLILEEHVSHLDGALKECLRQLRQAREEQEENVYDVVRKSAEWESRKSELQSEITELKTQLENTKTETGSNVMLADVLAKLEAAEKENSILKLKLFSKAQELQLRTNERDLSVHAAETASKQHLDSIKKITKLEAECRRLKAVARKVTVTNGCWSTTASSLYVESLTGSQSDIGERALVVENDISKLCRVESFDDDPCCPGSWDSALGLELGQCQPERTVGKCLMVPSNELDLMYDFLEMERLAALPMTHNSDNPGEMVDCGETHLAEELEAMIIRSAELEDCLKKITSEKENLEIVLEKCQIHLQASKDQCKQMEVELVGLKAQLALANEAHRDAQKEAETTKVSLDSYMHLLDEAKSNLVQIQDQLTSANETKRVVEVELKDATLRKESAESKLKAAELKLDTLNSSILTLNRELEKERNFSREAAAKCDELEADISRMKLDREHQRSAMIEEFRINQDRELAVATSKFAECQGTIASISRQLKSLQAFEVFLVDSDSGG